MSPLAQVEPHPMGLEKADISMQQVTLLWCLWRVRPDGYR